MRTASPAPDADTADRPIHVLHTFANNTEVPYLSWFARRAAQEGNVRYTFLIMYPERPRMTDEMEALGFKVVHIPFDERHRWTGMLRAIPRLWRHIRHERPDIVHCNLFDDSVPGLIAARLAGVKARQDTGFHWMHARRWVAADRWNDRLATRIIAISGENRRFIIEREGAPPHKIDLVHNGIPPELFTRQDPATMAMLRQRFGVEEHHLVLGTVARFIQWKGHHHIVGAARRIVDHVPNARFLLCGRGPQEQEIRAMVRDLGLEGHVVFTGRIEPRDMPSFYGLLDACLHAAVLEPFGLVYAEAMMNGAPVVSTPTGAALDAIEDGVNGILVPEASAEAMAEGVMRLLNSDRRAIGEAGRTTALRMYPFSVMWNGTMAVYRKALGMP
jgi:glycosyltransferase involved in cell wall biosynthesis